MSRMHFLPSCMNGMYVNILMYIIFYIRIGFQIDNLLLLLPRSSLIRILKTCVFLQDVFCMLHFKHYMQQVDLSMFMDLFLFLLDWKDGVWGLVLRVHGHFWKRVDCLGMCVNCGHFQHHKSIYGCWNNNQIIHYASIYK